MTGPMQFDVPDDVLSLVKPPDHRHLTYDNTMGRYWVTALGYLDIAAYKGADNGVWFICSAKCDDSCRAPGHKTLAEVRELFSSAAWRARHGMDPPADATIERLWETVREAARREPSTEE